MKTAKNEFSFASFSYQYFGWMGRLLARAFYSNSRVKLEKILEDTGLKIFPQAYFSVAGFIFILSVILTASIIILTGLIFIAPAPLLVILLGYAIPKILAQDRAQKLDLEVPFAGAYISVMATGGLSPYESLKRLKDCDLLPNFSKAVNDIEIDVQVKGSDPVSAIEKSAQNLPSKDYKDLMLGYTSTLRTGGDVIHYLVVRTEAMFKDLAAKVKTFGERASTLMETYITITILMTLTLTIMFMTTLSLQQFWHGNLSASTFLLYGYIILPLISLLFIYLSDSQQISRPLNDWRTYKVFLATLPLTLFLIITMFVPFAASSLTLSFAAPFAGFIVWLGNVLRLSAGYDAALGMGIALLVGAIPAAIANSYYAQKRKGVEHEVSSFMRDLTEARKTGASPENCIENLSGRNYGKFTPILETATIQIRWGLPFGVIYATFKEKIKSWIALINVYLLVDAIAVGGGTPETLETLTHFSETLSSLEKEKNQSLRPLAIMPYIGAGILLFSTIIFLGFSGTVMGSYSNQSIPFSMVATLILPPLMFQVFFVGLVTGKISSGETSAGFKHAAILIAVALILLPIANLLIAPLAGGFR
ncbi:MAG: type II secretion system F family protein [Candidatus Bathyarchaeia archaeon]